LAAEAGSEAPPLRIGAKPTSVLDPHFLPQQRKILCQPVSLGPQADATNPTVGGPAMWVDSSAICHNILEFSARVLATFPCGNLRFGAFPFEILLGSCERRM
jgi:hypothetical protein